MTIPNSWQDAVRAGHDAFIARQSSGNVEYNEEARFRGALARALATVDGSAPPAPRCAWQTRFVPADLPSRAP